MKKYFKSMLSKVINLIVSNFLQEVITFTRDKVKIFIFFIFFDNHKLFFHAMTSIID